MQNHSSRWLMPIFRSGTGMVLWDGWMWETSCLDFLPRVHSMKAVPGPAACREYTRQLDGGLGSMLPAGFSNQSY